MKNFRRLAVLTTAATYVLIFIGGLVRVSGAGLGCPDWPRCFGRWIPPLHAGQLPPDIDPAAFNFTLAWIEYINRLAGMGVGLLIAWLAILALIRLRQERSILWPAVGAALLTAFQGWQGSQVVASELEPVIVSVHMAIAFVIVSLLVWITVRAYQIEFQDLGRNSVYPRGLRTGTIVVWMVLIVQVILGTQVREAAEIVARQFPLLKDAELISRVGPIGWVHTILGVFAVTAVWVVAFLAVSQSRSPSPLVAQASWAMIGLGLVQVALGLVLFVIGIPPVAQVTHMFIASLLTGLALVNVVEIRRVVRQS